MSNMLKNEHWFTLLSTDELSAAAALYREPLYKYAADDSPEIHILFVGISPKADTFLRLSIVIGQMLNKTFHVHVLAPDANDYRKELHASATGLEQYTNICGNMPVSQPLVVFDFVDQKALNSRQTGKMIRERYLDRCRYIVADMDKKDVLLSSLASACKNANHASIVLYTGSTEIKPGPNFRLYSLDTWNEKTHAACIHLSRQAFRLHYHYDRKYGSIGQSQDESFLAFVGENAKSASGSRYSQYANLTAILHMKYKLASIGIDPSAGRQKTMEKCGRLLYGSDKTLYDELTALEHRRWMMEKLLLGFRAPTLAEMVHHCYNGVKASDKWWSGEHQFHNCLVESLPRSKSSLRGLTFSQWENLCGINLSLNEAIRKIQSSGFDALDQVSLTVHYLAGQKMLNLVSQIQEHIHKLSADIDLILQSGITVPDHLKRPDVELKSWIPLLASSGDATKLPRLIVNLKAYTRALSLSESLITAITDSLYSLAKLAREYHGLKDYKAMDEDIIDLLAHIYMPENATVLKIGAESSILDNITAPLLIEPSHLILTDVSQKDADIIAEFFRRRGDFLETEYHPVSKTDSRTRMSQLKNLILRTHKQEGMLIVDLTGASIAEMLNITEYIRTEAPDAAVIISNCQNQTVTNIHNFPEAACIRLVQKLFTDEIFQLIGAQKQHRNDEGDAINLRSESKLLWDFYNNHADRISEITVLLRAMINCTKHNQRVPLFMKMPDNPQYTPFQYHAMPVGLFQELQLEHILRELEKYRFVTDLNIIRHFNNTVSYSGSILSLLFKYPLIRNLLNLSAKHPMKLSFSPGKVIFDFANKNTKDLYVNVEFKSGSYHRITLQRNKESGNFITEQLHAHLKKMANEDHTIKHAFLTKKNVLDKTSSMTERVYSVILPDTNMMYLHYHEKGKEADEDQRIFAYPTALIDSLLMAMEQANLIEDLNIKDYVSAQDGEAKKSVSFLFTSSATLNHLSTPGSFLESRIYSEACDLNLFDHVETNYKFAWDDQLNSTSNEFDVLCISGLHLLLISAKATEGIKEHLYEVSAMAKRLSSTAQPVIIYSDRNRVSKSHITRAKDMGVLLAYAEGGNEDETISAVLRRGMEK